MIEKLLINFLTELLSGKSMIMLASIIISGFLSFIILALTNIVVWVTRRKDMKRSMISVLIAVVLLSGCAQVGPYMVSPAVYKSSERAASAANHANAELKLSEQLNEQLGRKRTIARHNVAMKEIASQRNLNKGVGVINSEGIIGGVPVIFTNDSRRNKTVFVKKISGDLKGQEFRIDVQKWDDKEKKLEVGDWDVRWTVENDSTVYPTDKRRILSVTPNPHYYYDRNSKNYHGGVTLNN